MEQSGEEMESVTHTISSTIPQDQLSNGLTKSPRPRKRSAAAAGQHGQSQAFFFVDSGASTREKRAHVMRHHIQAKKKQTMLTHQSDRESRREPRVFPWMKKSSPNAREVSEVPIDSEFMVRSIQSICSEPKADCCCCWQAATPRHSVSYAEIDQYKRLPSPRTVLDGFRDDPFMTVPVDHNVAWAEDHLYDLFVSRLTYWSGQNLHLKEKAFRAAISHRTTFEALVLGYCARWKPHLDGTPNDRMIQYYDSRVQQALSNTSPGGSELDDDSLCLTFTGLMLQEERFGDKHKAQQYAREAKNIQLYRKTQPMDTTCRSLLFFILCVMSPPSMGIGMDEKLKLVDFLRTGDRVMIEQTAEDYLTDVPQRATTFHFDSPLYQLLSSGPRPSQVPMESRNYVVNKNTPTMERSRTAALIYIVLALYHYRASRNQTARFLDHLHQIIRDRELDRNPACESFMFFLVEESYDADLRQPDRAWQTNELLNIHKKLPPDLQFRFNETLLGYLMLIPPVNLVDDFEGDLNSAVYGMNR
ncbi:hypothetical protein BGW36DRAFT_13456 [Talaromyces proteolyticus]|uniref:Transcription factor domain-containing protein n=1 Tax=Talaromyces proteolyticus TaxID=1131652 RepID=A0AAD4L0Q5_9EURO|nr:uncharacterized protein BGW36DRAFT_13456 [Talaromyces proteolyticus]KAH8705438.1 hypothetical protein BGW36DRAFT_13456 [Talaromyces proteolyticus]